MDECPAFSPARSLGPRPRGLCLRPHRAEPRRDPREQEACPRPHSQPVRAARAATAGQRSGPVGTQNGRPGREWDRALRAGQIADLEPSVPPRRLRSPSPASLAVRKGERHPPLAAAQAGGAPTLQEAPGLRKRRSLARRGNAPGSAQAPPIGIKPRPLDRPSASQTPPTRRRRSRP